MKLYSTNNKNLKTTLKRAVFRGPAPDQGLFMPAKIKKLDKSFFKNIESLNFKEISFEVAKNLLDDEISEKELKTLIEKTITFDAPIVEIEKNVYALELFHGPTLAFKDFGAQFLSQLISHFLKKKNKKIHVLVATSGDTGSAVAQGFLKMPNIDVILLYPSGKVSNIQKKQLTTIGHNIEALEVKGTFDDCQNLVKQAFSDPVLSKTLTLTSANSINIGRLLPQCFYYFYAYAQIKNKLNGNKLFFSIPSGNFGNLTAGLIAKKMGLPVCKFIAATNINATFPNYLKTGKYNPKPSKKTISNAMDVGAPNNFSRIRELYKNSLKKIKKDILSKSYTDKETKKAVKHVYSNSNYIMDPHGAIAYLGLKDFMKNNKKTTGIFFETAHPAKFADIIEPIIKTKIVFPGRLQKILNKKSQTIKINNKFEKFKEYLLSKSS